MPESCKDAGGGGAAHEARRKIQKTINIFCGARIAKPHNRRFFLGASKTENKQIASRIPLPDFRIYRLMKNTPQSAVGISYRSRKEVSIALCAADRK